MGKEYLIDNSVWDAVRKYHLPFDKEKKLLKFFEDKFKEKVFKIPYAVWQECRSQRSASEWGKQDTLLKHFPFLQEKLKKAYDAIEPELHLKMKAWLSGKGQRLSEVEYKIARDEFINGKQGKKPKYPADFELIYLAMQSKGKYIIVTEESKKANDGKLFKKIPLICEQEGLECINLVELLQKHEKEIAISFNYTPPLFKLTP